MKIASITRSDLEANSMYRCNVPARALERRGHQVDVFPQYKGEPRISLDRLKTYDVVQVYRLVVNDDPDYVSKLHEAGVAVCYDNDDHVPSVTPEMWDEMRRAYGMEDALIAVLQAEAEQALAIVPQMDLVTTPSRWLAERFDALGARNVAVVPNYLPPGIAATQPRTYDGFVIGWHALREHAWDREALRIEETLARVLDTHPDVRVVTIALRLNLDSNRYQCLPWVSLPALFNGIAGFDVGIAPLADIPFNHGRSDVKLREYAVAGVPWLASAVGPYLSHGREQGGELVDADGWFDAIDRLIRSPREWGRRRRRARKWAKQEHMGKMGELWESLLLDALDARQAA